MAAPGIDRSRAVAKADTQLRHHSRIPWNIMSGSTSFTPSFSPGLLKGKRALVTGGGTGQGNVVFVAGATDGYLLVDANNNGHLDSGASDFAIVLDHLNSTTLFGAADVI